ncbi:MAG: GNAT family N-acetyltransferase [Betaproteobacteria bacterium]
MQILVTELTRLERAALMQHYLALDSEDRRLRFGAPLADSSIARYVERIDFGGDAVFAVLDDRLHPIGAAHLARSRGHAELGVSVLAPHRGRGVGAALLARAHTRARNWGARELFMHCLTENAAMMHLARKQAMRVVSAAGEADARLALPRADAASYFDEVFQQRVALFDAALKRGRAWLGPGR